MVIFRVYVNLPENSEVVIKFTQIYDNYTIWLFNIAMENHNV